MLDKNYIRDQINNLVVEKGYDSRVQPLLIAFFTAMSNRYKYTEENLKNDIETYKDRVSKISFYNIGIDNYIYDSSKELVFDRELVEDLSTRNIERFIKTAIKANSVVLISDSYKAVEDFIEMSSIVNIYEYPDDLDNNISSMIANAFDIKIEELPQLYKEIQQKTSILDREKDFEEYDYFNNARTILYTINDRIKDIQNGENVREAYKAIYTLSLLNMKIKVCDDKLVDESTVKNYIQLVEQFDKYKNIFGINTEELENVAVDKSNWHLNANELLLQLEEQFKYVTKLDTYTEDKPKETYFDRKEIIQDQAKLNAQVDNTITLEQIEERVSKLIEQKGYPKEFETVIYEFFKRSAKDFEWDRETVEKKIENLSRNVDKFEYIVEKKSSMVACFECNEKRIAINYDIAFINNEQLASTVMHELRHATDQTVRESKKAFEQGFLFGDKLSENQSKGINELVTEAATVKITGKSPYKDKFATTYNLEGYEELSFATTMISSALGMSESEFIKLADKGELKFKEILDTKYPGLDLPKKVDNIKDILRNMYNKENGEHDVAGGIIGYIKLYDVLKEVYSQRNFIDMQMPGYDKTRARYDEYRLNKNMILAQRDLRAPKKTLKKLIPEYEEIKQKARVDKNEKESFKDIARGISSQIEKKDNLELAKSAKNIRRYKRKFINILGQKRKMLPEGKEEKVVKVNETFEDKRKNFLQKTKEEVNISEIKPTNNDTREGKTVVQEEVTQVDDSRQ